MALARLANGKITASRGYQSCVRMTIANEAITSDALAIKASAFSRHGLAGWKGVEDVYGRWCDRPAHPHRKALRRN